MLQPRIVVPLRRFLVQSPTICTQCRMRITGSRIAQPPIRTITSAPKLQRPEQAPKPADPAPEAKVEEAFVPKPLGRPIGFREPPRPGENKGNAKDKKDYSGMTMSERNLAKRKDLEEKLSTNYFRDFKNIRKYRSGKTFIANPRMFKKEAALYFPNFHGDTLLEKNADTTKVLKGKVSVVNVYSSQWGEAQVKTFTGKKENTTLHELLARHPNRAQMIDINIEENSVKAWIISLFKFQLRAARPQEDWGKYFVVRKGVSAKIREAIGLLNGRVGYVYLVDQNCKIRWASSANAEGTELQDFNRGIAKLLES